MVTVDAGQQSEEVLAAGEALLTGIGGMAAHVVITSASETLDDLLEYGRLDGMALVPLRWITLANVVSAVESMSCAGTSTNRAGQ